MFTDMTEALEAEALELTPLGSGQSAAAALVVARRARDKDDLTDLLGALGLPCGEDDLVRLLPHLTTADDTPIGDPMPVNAFTATAASMLANGDSPEHVRETLGLSKAELAEALQHTEPTAAAEAGTKEGTSAPEVTVPALVGTTDAGQIEALLAWAENHGTTSIRTRAARVRSHLTELTERRAADAAQRQAEERLASAKAELEAAQAQLRKVKAGGRAATEDQPSATMGPAQAPAGRRSSEELAAIRTWARANGHRVADRGTPAKKVLDAYDAAHRTDGLAEAS
ncbi:histone-like nucleoid-structuring protein Lsr2 [Streptomyces sp. NPDC029674]|uniref:Lsr2 family DNA-binding protein n=1 Tax=Streptomyces sp. NPDC029674 TaxID=3365297 RepID=UPI00384D414C